MTWRELNQNADLTNGLVATRHVDKVDGISRRTVQRRAARERWVRPQHGVVALPGARLDFVANSRAAALAAGERALVAGPAALHLAGLATSPAWIDVVVPADRVVRLRPPARVRRSRTLLTDDAKLVDGIGITRIERSLLDVAAWYGPDLAVGLILDAVQQRLTTAERILARASSRSPIRGRRQVVDACEAVAAGIQSAFELKIPPLLARAGLPAPVPQCPVETATRTVHLDFGWPDLRVGVECVGLRPHNDRQALRTDVRRLNTLRGNPWRLIWVEWTRLLLDEAGLVTEIGGELRRAARQAPQAS